MSPLDSSRDSSVHPKRILVVGGGPAGLVALRNLSEYGQFDRVELVERRDDIGGVWYLDPPNHPLNGNGGGGEGSRWPSPSYPGMIGNVLPEFLSFSHCPFPAPQRPHQPFPTLHETHEYLRAFAAGPVSRGGVVRLNTEVSGVEELEGGRGWRVSLKDWRPGAGGKAMEEIWDAVVIAVGWYDNPVWPETEGLEELREKGLAVHAKWWRGPARYEDKRCLIIGNANSSNDMAAQLVAASSKLPVYQSIRRAAFPGFPSLPDERIVMVAPVTKYSIEDASGRRPRVRVSLADGTVLNDVDAVLLGTGYRPFPAFVHVLGTSQATKGQLAPLVSASTQPPRIPSLHRHILYAHNPSLAFVGAPMAYTPFTIADVSSTWLALAWAGKIRYPDTVEGRLVFEAERLEMIERQRAGADNPTSFLVYSVLAAEEQPYAQSLKEEIVEARADLKDALPEWSEERTALREKMWATKLEALEFARDHTAPSFT